MAGSRGSKRTDWVSPVEPSSEGEYDLYCLPNAGSGTSAYRQWADRVPSGVDLQLVQLPGRENRIAEEPFERMEPLVDALVGALASRLSPPFGFFGHSMGALIGYEVARKLRRRRLPEPSHLLVSARRAPHMPRRFPDVHHLPRDEFVETLEELGGTPPEVLEEDVLDLFLPTIRADFTLCETYEHRDDRRLDCDVLVYHGSEDRWVTEEESRAWAEVTEGDAVVRTLDGGHFFIWDESSGFVGRLSKDLERVLASVRG